MIKKKGLFFGVYVTLIAQLIVTKSPGNTGIGLDSNCPAKTLLPSRSAVDPTVSVEAMLKDFVSVKSASPPELAALVEPVIVPVAFWISPERAVLVALIAVVCVLMEI